MKYIKYALIIFTAFSFWQLNAQVEEKDKEVIIIEKTVDENGNVISKQTRRLNGRYDETEIQELIDEDDAPTMGTFDLEGLGFRENALDRFRTKRPTIGVNLNFENGSAEVVGVTEGSGAQRADLRKGDRIISINGVAISAIEDIHDILESKSKRDKLTIVVFRDGEELEKEVSLSGNANRGFFYDLPEDGLFQFFGDGSDDFSIELDSLFEQMFDLDNLPKQFEQLRFFNSDRKASDDKRKRASLGVFIDDIGAGVLVSEVIKDSPAERAGILQGDVIISMDGQDITEFSSVADHMSSKNIGDTLEIELERDGKTKSISVILD